MRDGKEDSVGDKELDARGMLRNERRPLTVLYSTIDLNNFNRNNYNDSDSLILSFMHPPAII